MHSSMHVMCWSKWFMFLLNSSIFHLKDNKSPPRVILWLMGVLDTNWFLQLSWKPHGIERRAVFKEISRVRQIEETVWKAVWPMATTAQANLKWPVGTLKEGELFVNGHPQTLLYYSSTSLSKFTLQGWHFYAVWPVRRPRCYAEHEFDPIGSVQTSGWESVTQTWRWRPRSASLCQHLRGERLLAVQSELPACDMPLFLVGDFSRCCHAAVGLPITLSSMCCSCSLCSLARWASRRCDVELWRISELHSSRKM